MSLKGNCRVDYKSSPTKLERLFCLWVYKCIPANGGGSSVFGLRFCNPRTLGWALWCGVCAFVGYIFVTRNEACVIVVVGSGIYGLHKLEK